MNTRPDVWLVRRKGKRSTTYSLRWKDQRTGRCRSKTCGTDKALARRLQGQKREELAKGIAGDAIDVPWGEFVEQELELAAGRISPKGRLRLKCSLDALTDLCDPPSVGSVDYVMLEQFVTRRAERCKPATTVGDLSYIRSALRRAQKRGNMVHVPELPRVVVPEKPMRVLTPDEVERLTGACLDDRQRAFVWLSVTLGTRMGETLNLCWEGVSFADRLVRIQNREDWLTKSRRNRVAYLDDRGIELLQRLWDAAPKVLDDGKITPKAPWVFLTETGERWGQNIQRTWRALIRRAGIKHAGVHAMRRSFVSALVTAGVQQSIVTQVAGHQSPSTTHKYYAAIPVEACREAVSRLPWVTPSDTDDYANGAQVQAEGA